MLAHMCVLSSSSRLCLLVGCTHTHKHRGASGSGAADFRSGKLRRPPRAQSSGVGLRSTLLEDNQQLSFTDSITNTTNSSEASPRRGQWQPGCVVLLCRLKGEWEWLW